MATQMVDRMAVQIVDQTRSSPCASTRTQFFNGLTPKQPFMAENPFLRIWYKIVDLKGNAFKNTSISSCLLPFSASNSLVVDDFKKQIHREQYPLFGKKNIFIVSCSMDSEHLNLVLLSLQPWKSS